MCSFFHIFIFAYLKAANNPKHIIIIFTEELTNPENILKHKLILTAVFCRNHNDLSAWVIFLFFLHQIDYQTFLTLSEEDLKEVGVSTFGARRKMLMAISGKNLAELPGLFIDRSVGSE